MEQLLGSVFLAPHAFGVLHTVHWAWYLGRFEGSIPHVSHIAIVGLIISLCFLYDFH